MGERIEKGEAGRTMMKQKKWMFIGTGALLLVGSVWWLSGGDAEKEKIPTFTVQKGALQIDVLQGGEIRALRNEEVKSEIETPTKILSLIPEGYFVTEEDIRDGKVLVELDNTDIKNRIQDHEIQFQTTVAAYIDADENREIQKSENQSLVRGVQQDTLFALMDFEKYLGKEVSSQVLASVNLPKDAEQFEAFAATLDADSEQRLAAASVKPAAAKDKATSTQAGAAKKAPVKKSMISSQIDFSRYLQQQGSTDDGEAQQKLRQLEDSLLLRKSELAVAKQKMEASERLAAKGFISKAQLENDQVNHEKVELSVKTAGTELDLFKKYEFEKQCALQLSGYREAINKLQRTVRANRSKMAQTESRYQTAKRRYDMELARKEDLDHQLKACVIKAKQAGLVAYGNLNASSFTRLNEAIEEGATVRLRQTMLTIPDMSQMGVKINVHESQVKKVKLGQPAIVTVDAEPGKSLQGRVAELAVLPDSGSSRFTPNLKVYPCTIHITGAHSWLKPGMNAKVEIIVDQLADVLYVPVQSIEVESDHHFCYVNNGSKLERREITTGLFNDDFIEVRNGLTPGDLVALALPKKSAADMIMNGVPQRPSLPGAGGDSQDGGGDGTPADKDKQPNAGKKAVAAR